MNDTDKAPEFGSPSVHPADIEKEYDELAATYDRQHNEWKYDVPRRAVILLSEHASSSARVLDAGCGTGMSGIALWESGFTEVDGLDISGASLRKARRKEIYRGLIRTDLNHELPFIDDDYDAVLCADVFGHLPHAGGVLRELCRVTRSSGVVVFSQRDDLSDAYDFPSQLVELERARLWEQLYASKSVPYLPGNEDFAAAEITARYYAYRVL